MALNPSIGYYVSPEVSRYGTSNVAEVLSSPAGTYKLVHPKNGICTFTPLYSEPIIIL